MDGRVGFNSDEIRKKFFYLVKTACRSKSWETLRNIFGLSRGTFQSYKYGYNLIPKPLFEKMNDFLEKEKQDFFGKSIFIKPGNWGAKKGGNITFCKHPEICARGRAIAIKRKQKAAKIMPLILAKLDKDLCEFVGAIIGDESIDGYLDSRGNSKYHVYVTGDSRLDRDYLTQVLPTKISVFKINPYIYYRKDANAMILNFFSKNLFSFFTERLGFVPGNKTYTVMIPKEIMQSDNKLICDYSWDI